MNQSEQNAIEAAYAAILQGMVDTLLTNLITDTPDAEAKFRLGLQYARKTKEIVERITGEQS